MKSLHLPLAAGPKKRRHHRQHLSASPDGILRKLGLEGDNPGVFCGDWIGSGKVLKSVSPINGQVLATVRTATPEQYERTVARAREAFEKWRMVPAPRRGELVRQLGNALRDA